MERELDDQRHELFRNEVREFHGEEHEATLHAANNYAGSLRILKRFEEAKSLLRTTLLVVRRVLGESELMLWMRWTYARALYENPSCTLDEAREAVTTLEDVERTSRRVLGGAHPFTKTIERHLRALRAALRARETGGAREPVTTAN